MDYFEYFKPFSENDNLHAIITRLEKSRETKGEYYIDLSMVNHRLSTFDAAVFSRDGLVQALIAQRNNPIQEDSQRTNDESILGEWNEQFKLLSELFNIDEHHHIEDLFQNPKQALNQIIPNIKPYIFSINGSIAPGDKLNFLEMCYEHHLYIEMKIITTGKKAFYLENDDMTGILKGNMIFGASPLREVFSALAIEYDWDKIRKGKSELDISILKDNIINRTNHAELRTRLRAIIPECVRHIDFKCFSVGSGLNTSIKLCDIFGDHALIKYDIGATLSPENDVSFQRDRRDILDSNAMCELREIPDAVIVSHWHCDHIRGIEFYENYDIFRCLWVVPDILDARLKVSDFAKRLCLCIYLHESHDRKRYLYMVSNCFNNASVFKNKYIHIFRAKEHKSRIENSFNNNSGIAMTVKNNYDLLLTGDSDYENLPDALIYKSYYCLVVPHHGGKNTCINVSPSHRLRSIAIIPVGKGKLKKKRYGHPNENHINDLKRLNYTVVCTCDYGDVDICL